jgi:pyrroline-5-carboxylate reductase
MNLSEVKVGFIGAGNMAQALGKGMISAGKFIFN